MDLAIDLGTENTLIHGAIECAEPSVIAFKDGRPLAVGDAALRMEGRTGPSIRVVRPLENGVVVNPDAAVAMLRLMLRRQTYCMPHRVLISLPHAVTGIETRAFIDVATSLHAARVELVKEPLAAAVGSGLEVLRSQGQMIVDLGRGIVEAVVWVQGEIVAARSMRLEGQSENERLGQYLEGCHGLVVGAGQLERLKRELHASGGKDRIAVAGLKKPEQLPQRLWLAAAELLPLLEPYSQAIAACIQAALEETPVEILGDVMDQGIFLTGGGSLSAHVVKTLEGLLDIPLHRVREPLQAVAQGNRRILHDARLQRLALRV